MKTRNYLERIPVLLIVVGCFLPLICFSDGWSQSFQLGAREYRLVDGKWFNYSTGVKGDEILPSRLVIRRKDRAHLKQFDFQKLGVANVEVVSSRLLGGYYVLRVRGDQSAFSVARTLFQSAPIDYVEFDAIGQYLATPDDSHFPNQWNLDNTRLRMESAWDISTGSNSVILAVIDSGTDYNHEDLDGNLWNNTDELTGDGNGDGYPGVAGVDDDGDGLVDEDSQERQPGESGYTNDLFQDDDENGFIDDFHGWDFNADDNDPMDEYRHGTAVAGIAVAQTNNYEYGNGQWQYVGVAGIAGGWGTVQGVQMMVLRLDDSGTEGMFVASAAQAITYASENRAHVMNMSFGWGNHYQYFQDAVDNAVNIYDCVLIASAGNNGGTENQDRSIRYPARYSNTVAVGATDLNDVRWEEDIQGSAVGPQLDVMAPGGVAAIWTTDITGSAGYDSGDYTGTFGGTSASAPHVSGAAALIRSLDPNLDWDEVRDVLRLTADKVAGMNGQNRTNNYGYGRVNAYRAVRELYVPDVYPTIEAAYAQATNGQRVVVTSGTHTFTDDLDVPNGRGLELRSGVTLRFASGARLEVQYGGEIYFTWSDGDPPITLEDNGQGDWVGLTLNYTSNPVIRGGVFRNMTEGIRCIGTQVQIQDCQITDSRYGVRMESFSGGQIQRSVFSDNMESSYGYGVWCWGYSGPSIRPFNDFFDNRYGIHGDNTSNFEAGLISGADWGKNDMVSNLVLDVYSANPATVDAIRDWWGDPPNPQVNQYVIWQPALGYDPTTSGLLANGDAMPLNSAQSPESTFHQARAAYRNGLYDKALSLFEQAIIERPDSHEAEQSVLYIAQCLDKLGQENQIIAHLTGIAAEHATFRVGGVANARTAVEAMRSQDLDAAVALAAALVEAFPGEDLRMHALYLLGTAHADGFADEDAGASYFRQLVGEFPHGVLADLARERVGLFPPGEGGAFGRETDQQRIDSDLPKVFALESNYPNPFNPSTTVRYALPRQSHVVLSVYNALGQQVSAIQDGVEPAGTHTIRWDGRDAEGRRLPSGVYFLKMGAGEFVHTVKVLIAR